MGLLYRPHPVTCSAWPPQVLPLVEAYFVLSDARARYSRPPDRKLAGSSVERELGTSSEPSRAASPAPLFTPISRVGSSSSGGLPAAGSASLESQVPYIRYFFQCVNSLTLARHLWVFSCTFRGHAAVRDASEAYLCR